MGIRTDSQSSGRAVTGMVHTRPLFIIVIVSCCGVNLLHAQYPDIFISEVMAANASTLRSPDYSEFDDWIEITNLGAADIDLAGCYLTDNLAKPSKWRIPAHAVVPARGCLLFWADGRDVGIHTNFKLDKEGEAIGVFDRNAVLIDKLTYGPQRQDVSYGRSVQAGSVCGYFDQPTPGAVNNSTAYIGLVPSPQFYPPGGFYAGRQRISLSVPDAGAEIRYTLDGTPVRADSLLYSEPIVIDVTTPFRARAFASQKLPSDIVTYTYFIDEPVHLPVVSLVTDPANLFDDQMGIYVVGTNGVADNCSDVPMNLNQDWERPVNVELYETDGHAGLNQQAGVKIFGGCSRTRYPQKPLALYARSVYGSSSFAYPLFPDKPINQFESFLLRCSGDDQPLTLFRDALAQSVLIPDMDVDTQAYRPAVVYINGVYWGIHNLREKISEHYLASNYHLDADDINLLTGNPQNPWNVIAGSADHYNAMIEFIRASDMADPENYAIVQARMDVSQYIDYQIAQIYLAGADWPCNNIKFWRANSGYYSRWRWICYDMDWTFLEPTRNLLTMATEEDCQCTWPNPPWSTLLFRKLIENAKFRNEFIQRYAFYMNTTFRPERLLGIIEEMEARLAPEIPRHIERWGGQTVPDPEPWVWPTFDSVPRWEANVEVLKWFARERPQYARQQVIDFFQLSGTARLTILTTPSGAGHYTINDRELEGDGDLGIYFRDTPLVVEAKPRAGYRFSLWQVGRSEWTEPRVELTLSSDTVLFPHFEEAHTD